MSHRRKSIIALACAAAVALLTVPAVAHGDDPSLPSGPSIPSIDCVREGDKSRCSKYVQLDVLNLASTPVDVRFPESSDGTGGVKRESRDGWTGLHSESMTYEPGSPGPMQSVALSGMHERRVVCYDPGAPCDQWETYEYDNFFSVAVRRTGHPTDRSAAVLKHSALGRTEDVVRNATLVLDRQLGSSLRVALERVPGVTSNRFSDWYRLVITEQDPGIPEGVTALGPAELRYTGLTDIGWSWRATLDGLKPGVDYKLSCTNSAGAPPPAVENMTVNGVRAGGQYGTLESMWTTANHAGEIVLRAPTEFGWWCAARAATYEASATRLTGESVSAPVYRIEVPERVRTYPTTLPADIGVAPYRVEARRGSDWEELGTVLPIAAPHVDRGSRRVTFGTASFYLENTEGYSKLRITGGFGMSEVDLASAKAPPSDLSQAAITALEVKPTTGEPLSPNGLEQEAMEVRLIDDGELINPSDHPSLARLYDYVYFRDASGELITGMFDEDGYARVSPDRGSYVTTPQGLQANSSASSSSAMRHFLSTTYEGPVQVRAHLSVDGARQSKLSTAVYGEDWPVQAVPSVTAPTSVDLVDVLGRSVPAMDPTNGVLYHPGNGRRAAAGVLTSYIAAATDDDVGVRTPYLGSYVMESGALQLIGDGYGGQQLDARFIAGDGTHVTAVLPGE